MTPEQISYDFYKITQALHTSITISKDERAKLLKAIMAGETPEGPKVDWIRSVANKVVALLEEETQKYNTKSPMRVLPEDLLDVLATSYRWLKEE
jgi:hypothetical protein